MKDTYKELYKELVKAYYDRHFEETFERIMNDEFESKEKAKEVLAILCGVDAPEQMDDYEFMQEVVHRIVSHRVREKIINKLSECDTNCEVKEGKTACQLVCPMDAIINKKSGNERWLDENKCITCGRCIEVCDHGKFVDTPQFLAMAGMLKEEEVVAIVAPAIAGQFGKDVSLDQLREALVMVGFTDMIEVAFAADVLSLKEAFEFNEHVHKKGDMMISSCCCPVWVTLMKNIYNKLIPDFSPSVSPMIAMGRIIKHFHPDQKVVFIGPCVAKKAEAKEPDLAGTIDFVLTFQELQLIFETLEIKPEELKGLPAVDYASTGGRLYARAGGVSEAISDIVDQLFLEKRKLFTSAHVDGVKECKAMLSELEKGNNRVSFIEGMACPGGCVGGPKRNLPVEEGREAANATAYDSAVKIPINSEVMQDLLEQLGFKDMHDLIEHGCMFERTFD